MSIVLLAVRWRTRTNPWKVQLRAARDGYEHFSADSTFSILTVACFTAQLVFKGVNFRLNFMFQPCHVLTAMLIFLCFAPRKSLAAAWVFNVYMHLVYAPWLALLMPGKNTTRKVLPTRAPSSSSSS